MERHQGRRDLWVSGATPSHERVDNIVSYNVCLADRMAVAFAGGDPPSDATFERLADDNRFSFADT
jgi:hypothetical protein